VEKLGAHVVDVHVDAGVDVVEQIPAGMVGVLVYHEVIAAVPAPIGTNRPVPRRNFKVETARHPKAMMLWIEAFNAVTVRWAKVLETSVFKRMVNVIALIVRPVVPVPVVFVDMWQGIDMTSHVALGFGLGMRVVPPFRRWRNAALIGARPILPPFLTMLLTALRENRKRRE